MTAPKRISFEKIVNALNKDELIDYCQSYQIDVSNIKYARNLNFYRRGLIKAMENEHNTKDINIKSFVKSFAAGLSHDTIIKIYPNYDNYKAESKIKKEQRKFIKDTKEQEANYEDAYIDYYTSPHKKQPSQVHKIEYLTEEEIRRQKDKQIMKALIAQRKKEDFERFNKDKINSSPFTEKIDAIKATVEKQLRKLRELEEQDNEWKQAQKRQQEQENDYEQAYENYYSMNAKDKEPLKGTSKLSFQPIDMDASFTPITEPEKRIHKALLKPLDTDIMVDNLTFEERNEMGLLLKDFYEKHIKTLELNRKLLVGYFVNGSWLYRPLDNEDVRKTLEKMLNGNYVFSCDNIPTIGSDVEMNVSLSFIDAIKFKPSENEKAEGQRNRRNPGGFYPKRLKHEWRWFKAFLRELAIGCNLYSYKHKCPKRWLKYCCLVYAIQQAYPEETTLIEEINNRLMGNRYISTDKLTEIGNMFNIQFTLRSKDNKDSKTRKGNDKNNGVYGPQDAKYKVDLARMENHYFIYKTFPCSAFFIKHYLEIIKGNPIKDKDDFLKRCQIYERRASGTWKVNVSKAHITSLNLIDELDKAGAFEPLYRNDKDVDLACVHEWVDKEDDNKELTIEDYNIKKLEEKETKKKKAIDENLIYYADFETCSKDAIIDNIKTKQEVAFMLCIQTRDGSERKTFKGFNCAEQLMDYLPNGSIVYFHNLGFDGRLLMKFSIKSNIMKGSKIITQKHDYKGKHITFKDSYSIFPQALRTFPSSFKKEFAGLNIQKELFPYRYYSYNRLIANNNIGIISECGDDEQPRWTPEQRKQFNDNINKIPNCRLDNDKFDMLLYCEFYCEQDVNVLRIGFNAFREAALKEPIEMDIFELTTAPSLANEYLNRNVFYPNGNLFTYSGKLQKYIMGAIYGGRCMTKQNKRWLVDNTILDDFDACSLYPSAMNRLFTIEGKPEIIEKKLIDDEIYDENKQHYLLKHAFEENQLKPTKDKFISYFIVDIEIINVGINRDFPLIVNRDEITKTNMNVNENISMRVDLMMLEDLVRFQKIAYKVKGGLIWLGNRDHRIREVISRLFNQRAQYKKEGNSVQQVIKLIMNSGYGKSIQKPITADVKFIPDSKFNHFTFEHYHNINTIKKVADSDTWMISVNKQLNKQFNNCVFGVSVLSMSKRIMNEVMCLAEDLKIPIYYQDTDSMHIEHDKLETLANEYRKLYNRELIGENIMGRFHNDFDELPDAYCTFHVSLGKKMYYDELKNDKGEHAEHFRMKGIPNDVIVDYANKKFNGDVKALYMYLYNGGSIEFDLTATKTTFQMEKTGEILHKNEFNRKVKATAPMA